MVFLQLSKWTLNSKAPYVHAKPEEFENAALFLRLGLPSTLILQENRAFRKRSSNRRNLKTPALCFSDVWTENIILKTEVFQNDVVLIIMWLTQERTQAKLAPVMAAFSHFSGASVGNKHLMRSRSENNARYPGVVCTGRKSSIISRFVFIVRTI